ncbi:DUF6036 family nucleotidyltransferase [Clavibacter sp. VKM Ac-2873]|uniref:DUF6036 family nucleotidyltransferase n=1 Tax=Clavibacter sp. VKM Ac-2873 TaxID=2783813 RepID=UPI001E3EEE6A|nr:DUF6036 family nucleotidyltransferase [Clavibacter sp. VKM Ac-2873]
MAMLDRHDLESALRELATILLERGIAGEIQIFGGAALALGLFDRETTVDIDARLRFDADIAEVVQLIAMRRGWQHDWINDAGKGFIPLFGREVDWQTVFDRDGVTIQLASAEALLAMKLNANRPGRDDEDIAQLLTICGVSSVGGAEEVFEAYYPGDCLSERAMRMVGGILEGGLPERAAVPPAPRLER